VKRNWGGQIEEDEMKWVCDMHGAEENCARVLGGKPKLTL